MSINMSCFCAAVVIMSSQLFAESITFGTDDATFAIEFVEVSSPGNAPDMDERLPPAERGVIGSVEYEFHIAKFETPCSAIELAFRNGAFPSFATWDCAQSDVPEVNLAPTEIVDFVNWLNTSSGFAPAYKTSGLSAEWEPTDQGFNPSNPLRNSNAKYFLTSRDEWYKAAFYDSAAGVYYDYATGSDEQPTAVTSGTDSNTAVYCTPFDGCVPGNPAFLLPAPVDQSGGLSSFGTMGQLGNGSEWEEGFGSFRAGANACRETPGFPCSMSPGVSAWDSRYGNPFATAGFRVVAVTIPETSSGRLLVFGLLLLTAGCRRRP